MDRNIGHSVINANGLSVEPVLQTPDVVKAPIRTFWMRVKEAAEEGNLPATQVAVAKRLDISQGSVTLWNQPGGYPTLENTISLAKWLNVNVEWLLTERGPKRPIPQDATAQRLWDLWSQLDDVTKGELVGIASGTLRRQSQADAPKAPQRIEGKS